MTPEDRASLLQDRIHEYTGAVRAGVSVQACRHGSLRRSCETCDLTEDVERLERERDRALTQFDDALGRLQQAHEERDALREALRELIRIDVCGMGVIGWDAAMDRARAVLGEAT